MKKQWNEMARAAHVARCAEADAANPGLNPASLPARQARAARLRAVAEAADAVYLRALELLPPSERAAAKHVLARMPGLASALNTPDTAGRGRNRRRHP